MVGHHWIQNIWKWGAGHLQIQKKKPQLGPNAHVTQKPQILYIFETLQF